MSTCEIQDKEKEESNVDHLTGAIGEFGRWQLMLFVMMMAPTKLVSFWAKLVIIFLAPKTTFRCVERLNSSEVIVNSTCYTDCLQYEYHSQSDNTIISQWDLICDRQWLANLTQTLFVFGVLVGSVLFGFISDRYGRRPSLLMSATLKVITAFITAFAPTYWVFTFLRLIEGIATAGFMFAPHILFLEITSPRKRAMINCYSCIPAPMGAVVLPLFAYFLSSWNHFLLGIAVFQLVFFTYFFLVPESPKWLLSVGKTEEANAVMTKAAKCNGLPTDHIPQAIQDIMYNEKGKKSHGKATYLDLFLKPSLRLKNFLSCVMWFMVGFSFYGSYQYIGQTSDSVFITVALTGAMQCPGMLLGGVCNKLYGRRVCQISCLIVFAICNALLAAPDHWFYFKLVVGTIGVAAASGSFSGLYVYTAELFPTVARNMALGVSSTMSRVGAMISPFVAGLGLSYHFVPPILFAIAPLVAAVACYFLPETKDTQLIDHIED